MEFRLLRADAIDARISTVKKNGLSLLLYKDARCDMNILDETVGSENWQRKHEVINGNLFCNVGIAVPREGSREWVWKQDVGVESYTEKEKGQASDAFKRACFNWGIGRELYTAPFMWVSCESADIKPSGADKYTCYDRFIVTEIEYIGKKISFVKVYNLSKKMYITYGKKSGDQNKENNAAENDSNDVSGNKIGKTKAKAFKKFLEEAGISVEKLCEQYRVKSLDEMTEKMHTRIIERVKAAKEERNAGQGES